MSTLKKSLRTMVEAWLLWGAKTRSSPLQQSRRKDGDLALPARPSTEIVRCPKGIHVESSPTRAIGADWLASGDLMPQGQQLEIALVPRLSVE